MLFRSLPPTTVQCCSESLNKVGDLELFERLKTTNLQFFDTNNVQKMIVSSPHCLDTFSKQYGRDYKVIHLSELLSELIKAGKLNPVKDLGGVKVTYHDPCYLGRHNHIYDAPRDVLQAIPGLEFVEMDRNREQSMCCGGGGGGLWLEKLKGERLSDLRIEQAMATGATVLATACPYCIAMFEDSILTLNVADKIQVKDVAELLLESLDLEVE